MVSTVTPNAGANSSNIGRAFLPPVLLHVGPIHTTTVLPLSSGSACNCVGVDIICWDVIDDGGATKALALATLEARIADTIVEIIMVALGLEKLLSKLKSPNHGEEHEPARASIHALIFCSEKKRNRKAACKQQQQ